MKVEKWNLKDKEVNVEILEEHEIETNEDLDFTQDLTEIIRDPNLARRIDISE